MFRKTSDVNPDFSRICRLNGTGIKTEDSMADARKKIYNPSIHDSHGNETHPHLSTRHVCVEFSRSFHDSWRRLAWDTFSLASSGLTWVSIPAKKFPFSRAHPRFENSIEIPSPRARASWPPRMFPYEFPCDGTSRDDREDDYGDRRAWFMNIHNGALESGER